MLTAKQSDLMFNYIIGFAQENHKLRIELINEFVEVARFNLFSTGATMPDKDPTINDLRQLSINPNTGLPFDKIYFRTGDSGPNLAEIKLFEENPQNLLNGKFIKNTNHDQKIIDFCDNFHQLIKSLDLKVAPQEKGYASFFQSNVSSESDEPQESNDVRHVNAPQ